MHSPSNDESIYKISYIDSLIWSTKSNVSWTSYVYNILKLLGLDEVWENQGCFLENVNSASIHSALHGKYSQAWLNHISKDSPNKLLNYSTFKNDFKLENYILTIPLEKRRNLTKLRISAHSLAIEKGRHSNPRIPIDQRICKFCSNVCIETEKHFLLECIAYEKERNIMNNVLKECSVIDIYDIDNAYIYLMSYLNGDNEITQIICNFVNESTEKRNNINAFISSCNLNVVSFTLEVFKLLAIEYD